MPPATAPTTGAELDPLTHPTMDVDQYADVMGISRSSGYAAVHRGEVPVVVIGRRFRIPTAWVRRQLQMDPPAGVPG
jgi:excisionase family DNA binding protein